MYEEDLEAEFNQIVAETNSSENLRSKFFAAKEAFTAAESVSKELEAKYSKWVRLIRSKHPSEIPISSYKKLANLHEEIRKAHAIERNARYDALLVQQEALKAGMIDKHETLSSNEFNSRGTKSQSKFKLDLGGPKNMTFYSDDSMSVNNREVMELELAAWAEVSLSKAREMYVEAAQAEGDDFYTSFDNLCVNLFQEYGRQWSKNRVFIDLETTSLDPYWGEIIEIGIVEVDPSGNVVRTVNERFDLERPDVRDNLGVGATHIHRITPESVKGKRKFTDLEVQQELGEILNRGDIVLVPHNAAFEHTFLSEHLKGYHAYHAKDSAKSLRKREKTYEQGTPECLTTDTMNICTYLMESKGNSLKIFATSNGISAEEYEETSHGAYADADMTRRALFNFKHTLQNEMPEGERPPKKNKLNLF